MGLEQQFTATAFLSDGSSMDVTNNAALSWTSSAPTIATIDNADRKGLATGVAVGSTTITASGTTNGTPFSASAELTVTSALITSIQVSPSSTIVPIGQTVQLTAMATLSNGNTADMTSFITWTTDNPTVATVDSNGLATGVVAGSTTIRATDPTTSITDAVALDVAPLPNFDLGCTEGLVNTSNGKTYTCPLTQAEADRVGAAYQLTYTENGKTYVRMYWSQANTYCQTTLGQGFRLASKDELVALYNEKGNMETAYGWPSQFGYWSATPSTTPGYYYWVYLFNGVVGDDPNTGTSAGISFISCVRG
ncbi:Bacterial Ig-like domain (group 2) [compost metagenome]